MKNYLLWLTPICFLFTILISCHKQAEVQVSTPDFITQAKQWTSMHLQNKSDTAGSDGQAFKPANRILRWDKLKKETSGNTLSLWIPVNYPQTKFITVNIDPHRLFNTNYLQQLHLWQDSLKAFHAELVTRFPDSNYIYGQNKFSGIVLVRDWQDHYLQELKYEKDGKTSKRMDKEPATPARNLPANNMDEICFYSYGYNYANMTRADEIWYWEIELGCISFFGGGGGDSGPSYSTYGSTISIAADTYGGGSAPNSVDDMPYIPNQTIVHGDNIIGNIRDYDKCFDNIPGADHHYTITLCVDQPIPNQRDPWGFQFGAGSGSTDFVSAGHTFLVLTDQRTNKKITRNIGFYPSNGASPISPVDQGQLNNDAAHDYNISLTIDVTSSQFSTILEFISHGNDQGYNYDLNSNNCTTFAVRALASGGINLPITAGAWPNGGGYDPGDLGEDIRSMQLPANMTRSTDLKAHPNTGTCL